MKHALIKDNRVVNIIVSGPGFAKTLPGYDQAVTLSAEDEKTVAIGWHYYTDFVPPSSLRVVPGRQTAGQLRWLTYIDASAFLKRLGSAKTAVLSSRDPRVTAFLRELDYCSYIDLADPDLVKTISELQAAVPEITADIAAALLDSKITEAESQAVRRDFIRYTI